MNLSLKVVLFICALVCFLLKAFGVPGRVDWMNLGFAFIVAAFLFG